MLFSGILTQIGINQGPVVLTGHLHPDYDSAASCLLMRHFLHQLEIDTRICLYGQMDAHGGAVLKKYGWDPALLFSPLPEDALLILCDCHTTKLPGRVIACADHHPTMDAPDIPVYQNESASSAGRVIYEAAMTHGLAPDRQADFLALSSVYMDTLSCSSSKFQEKDKPWIQETAARWGFDVPALQREGLCLTDLSQSADILCRNGFRDYIFGKYRVASSYLQVEAEDPSFVSDLLCRCAAACETQGYDVWLFLYYVPLKKTTDVYRYDRYIKKWTRERHTVLLSRGNDVIPALERSLLE